MPTNIKILSPAEIIAFDLPPVLNAGHRKELFHPSKSATDIIESFRTPINKITFGLLFGYFKATNKFFNPKDFQKSEIDFVCNDFNVPPDSVDFNKIDVTTLKRHKRIIRNLLGVTKFTEKSKQLLMQEALGLCSSQIKPITTFDLLVNYLMDKKIEVPGYYVLASIITAALNEYEKSLLSSLNQVMPQSDKRFLDSLLKGSDANLKLLRYKLTELKKASQSLRPTGIKENIQGLLYFKGLYEKLQEVSSHLNLNIQTTRYYAELVIKSQTFQMIRREDNKYLLLVCFIIHQYFTLNDYLIDSLIQSSQTARNAASKKYELQYFINREQRQKTMKKTFEKAKGHFIATEQTFKNLLDILSNEGRSSDQRVEEAKTFIIKHLSASSPSMKDEITKIESDLSRLKDDDFYDILESTSVKLQNRVSEIIKHVCFDRESPNKKLLKAIDYYKQKDGAIGIDAPVDFLKQEDKDALLDDHKKIRVSLYKVLLFQEIAKAIKSGALNLLYSYKYQSFDKYLIPQQEWDKNKASIIRRAGLDAFIDFKTVKNNLDITIKTHFELTNKNIKDKKNTFVKFSPLSKLIVTTPPLKEKETLGSQVKDLFPKDRDISLFEILSTVNKVTGFLNSFEHLKLKMHWGKPEDTTFFAGIIGLGCNLGLSKISRISNGIKFTTLENTVNWRFTVENINHANKKILDVINLLSLPRVYQKDSEFIHTSSDGQKFGVSVDSLNARRSYKYFGQYQGVSCLGFNDERHIIFHSTVTTPSDRESTYMLDGLNTDDELNKDDGLEPEKIDMHSTDTHGYTEINFAGMYFMKKFYAPRLKNLRKQRLYSFEHRSVYKRLGYKILPHERLDPKVIEDEWDNILRFMATIKLKHTSASQLLQRLSHYSRQHPLFRAIKNLGKIIKTIFILQYIDNVELRQAIEMQLNKTENLNKFSKAVFFGNNQEFTQRTKEEQLKADACKRLIQNAIICWNYLYLSDLIYKTTDPFERSRLIKIIKNGSIVVWGHINLQGNYDFSDAVLKNSINFSLPKLVDLDVA